MESLDVIPPVRRKDASHIYFSMTKSLCRECREPVDAKILIRNEEVFLDKFCPKHGHQNCLVSSSVQWYLQALNFLSPGTPPDEFLKPVSKGCPFDCGPCPSHQQRVYLSVDADGHHSAEGRKLLEVDAEPSLDFLGDTLRALAQDPELQIVELQVAGSRSEVGRGRRLTIPDIHRLIETASKGLLSGNDFIPSPLAHPHCYSISYVLILEGGEYVPLTRVLSRAMVFDLLRDSLYLQPSARLEGALRQALNEVDGGSAGLREGLERALAESFSGTPAAMAAFRRLIKAIYIHALMDVEDFDVSRVMKCPVGIAQEDGTNVPLCAHNVVYSAL